MADTRPTPIQYVAYVYGRRLPDSMRSWVANDLAGPGAVRRHMIRMALPPLLVLAPFWPIYMWAILMALALNKIWRRYRLGQHGLDPNLVDAIQREKDARIHEDYIRRYGPRPEEAKWQSNSSPF